MILLIASVSMPFIPPFSFEKTYKAFARSTAVAAVGAAGPPGAAMLRPPASAAGTSARWRSGRVPRREQRGRHQRTPASVAVPCPRVHKKPFRGPPTNMAEPERMGLERESSEAEDERMHILRLPEELIAVVCGTLFWPATTPYHTLTLPLVCKAFGRACNTASARMLRLGSRLCLVADMLEAAPTGPLDDWSLGHAWGALQQALYGVGFL